MHTLLLAIAALMIAPACAATADRGPAWPKRADRDTDGGESIAPHPVQTTTFLTSADDDGVSDAKATSPAVKATAVKATAVKATAPAAAKPTVTPTGPAAGDESLFGDDLTIEFED